MQLGRYPMPCSQQGKRQRPSARRAYLGLVQRVKGCIRDAIGHQRCSVGPVISSHQQI